MDAKLLYISIYPYIALCVSVTGAKMQSFQSKPTFAASRALHDSLSQSASEMSMVGICLRGCVETRGSAAREAGPLLTSELLLVFLESYTCPHSSQPLKTRRSVYACKAIPKDTHTCLHRRVSIYLSLYSSVCIFLQQEMTHIDCVTALLESHSKACQPVQPQS